MPAAALFRWGLTCLLLAPLAFLAWLLAAGGGAAMQPSTPELVTALVTAWGVLAPIVAVLLVVAGGVLNALAIRRGVRGVERVATGDWDAPAPPRGPRIIFPAGWDESHPAPARSQRLSRRALGGILAAALLVWAGVIAWVLVAEHPLALAGGALGLGEVYAAWNPVSRSGFVVAVVVWAGLALVAALALALLGRMPRAGLDRLLAPRRFIALAAIAGSALVVAAMPAYLMLGVGLVDDLTTALGSRLGGGPSAGSWFVLQGGVALSALAILLTVPSWRRAPRRDPEPSEGLITRG